MHKPFAHTLTATDRKFISRWLLGISAVYGALALLVVAIAVIGHFDTAKHDEIAAMPSSGR
jgi:hypothetical protein